MSELMIYSLKVGGCLAVFYLFFKLLLSRETFHRLNRMVLLAALVLSFVLPFCVITIYREVPIMLQITEGAEIPSDLVAEPETEAFPWERLAVAVFLLGAGVTFCATLCSLASVIRLIRRGRRKPLGEGMVLVHTDRAVTPFSWGRYIVLSEQDAAESGGEIIVHERAHLRLHHSWDLLVTDIAGCLQWFNPAMWLLRRELRAIHEYEADEAVLDSGVDAKAYQLLLIKKAAGGRWYSVANSFNHSKLKNRITMMLQKKSSRWAGAKALLVLPLAGFALGAFAETAYVFPEDKAAKGSDTTATSLFEVKVVGYGTQAKTFPGMLKIAGAPVDGETTPAPAAKAEVRSDNSSQGRVEGRLQLPNGKQPVWVVDGKEIDPEAAKELNASEIFSISVVKDSTVRRTYPDRDVDGMIVITTKKAEAASIATKEAEDTFSANVAGKTLRIADGDKDPIVIVDGVRSKNDVLKVLDPEKIESIRVLKGESAVKTYGPEAVNGVVVVTTKQGESAQAGKQEPPRFIVASKEFKGALGDGLSVGFRDGRFVCPQVGLYMLDNKESTKAELEALDPETIRSVEGFKGETAVKKYGEKAREGVVVFKTRK